MSRALALLLFAAAGFAEIGGGSLAHIGSVPPDNSDSRGMDVQGTTV